MIIGGIVGVIALLTSDVKLNGEMIYYVVLACILLIFAIPIAFAENKSKQEQEQDHQKSKATFESRKAQYDKVDSRPALATRSLRLLAQAAYFTAFGRKILMRFLLYHSMNKKTATVPDGSLLQNWRFRFRKK